MISAGDERRKYDAAAGMASHGIGSIVPALTKKRKDGHPEY